MKAKSIKGKSAEEIGAVFYQSISDGLKPTLALTFSFAGRFVAFGPLIKEEIEV